jgi:soluble lytic murein transglycosylase-like protein
VRCLRWSVLPALMAASCGSVQRDEPPQVEPVSVLSEPVFHRADSLSLAGMAAIASDTLLGLSESHPELRDEILFRLMGLHHGQATEDEFITLLDSLELAGWGPLTGWKVSALDLAGRPDEALLFLSGQEPCLSGWLAWEADSLYTNTTVELPEDPSPGQIFGMALASPPGSLTRDEMGRLAEYASLFPSIRTVLLRELRLTEDTAGTWRLELLASMEPCEGRELLLGELRAAADSGSLQYWLDQLKGPAPLARVAAEELLQRFAGMYTPGWDAVDRLVSLGETELAMEYSAGGDLFHRSGSEMAVLLQEKRYEELLRVCQAVGAQAPDSLRARAALFRAHALRGAGNSGSVYYGAYLDFALDHPWHPQAREMAYNVGKYHDCEQEWNTAAEAYMVSLACSGSFEGDERAHWRGGFCLYMSGRQAEADSLWTLGCETWPSGYWRDEMLFFRARLAGERGMTAERDSLLDLVRTRHPWEFYGMLAARRLGVSDTMDFAVFEIRLMTEPVCSLAVAMTSRGYGYAAAEMLRSGSDDSQGSRAAALSLMGRHGSALTILRILDSRLREEGRMLPDSLLCLYFPSPYRGLADAATDTLMLESSMLQGIMREESYFDRRVVSGAGARGVVQLMPSTASDVARWYGLPLLTEEEFFDPAASVPYGAIYIDRQYRSFQGQQPLFLAAYNAGPGNADRWVGMHGWNPADPEMYIEQITYRETRVYVKKVLRSAWIYERR